MWLALATISVVDAQSHFTSTQEKDVIAFHSQKIYYVALNLKFDKSDADD